MGTNRAREKIPGGLTTEKGWWAGTGLNLPPASESRSRHLELAVGTKWAQELPRLYGITSVARRKTDCGIVSPRALAVLRLRANSNVAGRSTGRSAGLAPFRILSTK